MQETDEELMEEVRKGSDEAMAGLYERYASKIYHLARAMMGNEAMAQDVVSEVFFRVYRYKDRFRPTVSFKAWIYRIAKTVIFTFSRKKPPLPLEPDWIPSSSDPVHEVEKEVSREIFWQEFHRLHPQEQYLLTLYAVEGLSYTEISRLMGMSVSALKSRFHRIRDKLRESLKKRGEWNDL
ncbi:MAG: RNA polymerase sigma factor [bacterium JZ-2024 1]